MKRELLKAEEMDFNGIFRLARTYDLSSMATTAASAKPDLYIRQPGEQVFTYKKRKRRVAV